MLSVNFRSASEGAAMDEYLPLEKNRLDELLRGRERLIEQIRQSQKTIEHSRALVARIDTLLAQAGQKKPQV
jgi:ParB-like chromosome segregation protein Spo0J